ncbi:hypothetical protein [Halobacillus massiliensis]|uniref:hypothetical protein n=1 Tax=Halobacillus massiliensis TaxID=1926286 RepID=UPI0009E3C62F|nr:hypothetical protein [Halobacillus massiliensis]
MSNTYPCKVCGQVLKQTKQQEKTIAQLVEIIGALNRKIADLDQRQVKMERIVVPELFPRSTSSASS